MSEIGQLELKNAKAPSRWWMALDVAILLAGLALFWLVIEYDIPYRVTAAIIATGLILVGAFLLSHKVVMLLLSPRTTVCAVARTVMQEMIQTRLTLAMLGVLLVIVSAAPFVIGETDKLQYRIQQYLTYTLSLSFMLIALLTVFLGCASITKEVEDKQIFTVMTKPVSRLWYLVGKWLGLVLTAGLLLLLTGTAIYVFSTWFLQRQPAMDSLDRVAVTSQLFTARQSSEPKPPQALQDRMDAESQRRLDLLKQNQGEDYIASQGGEAKVLRQYVQEVLTEWRSMGPLGKGRDRTIFLFDNLQAAKEQAAITLESEINRRIEALNEESKQRMAADENVANYVRQQIEASVRQTGFAGQYLQLEYKVRATGQTPDDHSRLRFGVNGRWLGDPMQVPENIKQTLTIPVELIDDEGRIELLVQNYNESASVSFTRKEGMVLLYRVGTFGPNYMRAMLMMLLKLSFIAALALAAGSFLGFPVAVLLSLLVLGGATYSHYILESVSTYAGASPDGGTPWVQLAIKYIAWLFTAPLEQYGRYQPVPSLIDGRLIPWPDVARCAMWIGVGWTGVMGLLGGFIYSRRELARVQV